MPPLIEHVTLYPLISDLFKNSNSLAVVTEIIHRRLFGWLYYLFEPTVCIISEENCANLALPSVHKM
jgi:hypothetical protein